MNRIRRAAIGVILAGFAVAAAPQAASADVTVTPNVAPKGGAAELTFHVTEERPGAHTTKVQLIPPPETPIAEVYPMSVDGWAPLTTSKKLPKPIELIHGAQTTSIMTSVTWTRIGTKPQPEALLTVSLGPMPETDETTFTMVQTYSDGTVVRWGEGGKPGPVVKLVTAPEAAAAGGHHAGTDEQAGAADEEVVEVIEEASGEQPWLLLILGGALLIGLAFTAETLALFAFERRTPIA